MLDRASIPPELETVDGCFSLFRTASARLQTALESGSADQIGEASRQWFQFATLTFRAYCRPENWPNGTLSQPKEALPLVLASVVANQIEYLSIGRITGMMDWARKRGNEPGPHENRDIGYAVAYIKAVRAGLITDPSPLKSVASAYGANLRTVKRWQAKYEFVLPTDFFPDAQDSERGALLDVAMREHGERYRLAGRTADAIDSRARKRRQG